MVTKSLAITSLLAGAALAVPYPPHAADPSGIKTIPPPPSFHMKTPGSGNYMPSTAGKVTPSKTSPSSPAAVNQIEKRVKFETVTNSKLARFDNSNIQDGAGAGSDSYTMYWGSGSTGEGWPAQSRWVSFEDMFNNYKPEMFSSCSWFGQANDSGPEVGAIWDGIQSASNAYGVDHRFILAVIMQESGGCVRVPTTNFGVRNPGLMQDHNGGATCNEGGRVQNPCPSASIYQMINEGTAGTLDGDGLANCINEAGTSDVSAFYRAARIYNSGSISSTGQLQNGIATHCYASDIANRLTGWVNAPSGCTCDSNPGSCGITTN